MMFRLHRLILIQGCFWAVTDIMCSVKRVDIMLPSLLKPTSSHMATSSLLASNACGNEIIIVGVETLPLCGSIFGGNPRSLRRYFFTVNAKRFRGGSVVPSNVSVARRPFVARPESSTRLSRTPLKRGNNPMDHRGLFLDGARNGSRASMVMLSTRKCVEINTSQTVLSVVREQQSILE